ncbi:MAG: hypothetical protein JNL70_27295 [Saprospiraceae bacterium]|nr:hypothetical protein [Saprospiraceae bacterium]
MTKRILFFLLSNFLFTVVQAQNNTARLLKNHWHVFPTTLLTPPNAAVLGQNIHQHGYKTSLPTSLLKTLVQNNVVEEVLTAQNSHRLDWVQNTDWIFEQHFDMTEKEIESSKIDLILRGVDTYAGVFLNDYFVVKTNDVEKVWTTDVTSIVKKKDNVLRIYFSAVLNQDVFTKRKQSDAPAESCSFGLKSVELLFDGSQGIDNQITKPVAHVQPAKKTIEKDVKWHYAIDKDTFKLIVVNERMEKAKGDFLIDVYDSEGRLLFNDARMMYAASQSTVNFYQYDLKTMLQGADLSKVKVVTTWKKWTDRLEHITRTFEFSSKDKEYLATKSEVKK